MLVLCFRQVPTEPDSSSLPEFVLTDFDELNSDTPSQGALSLNLEGSISCVAGQYRENLLFDNEFEMLER